MRSSRGRASGQLKKRHVCQLKKRVCVVQPRGRLEAPSSGSRDSMAGADLAGGGTFPTASNSERKRGPRLAHATRYPGVSDNGASSLLGAMLLRCNQRLV